MEYHENGALTNTTLQLHRHLLQGLRHGDPGQAGKRATPVRAVQRGIQERKNGRKKRDTRRRITRRRGRAYGVRFVGYAPGLDIQQEADCIAMIGRWMRPNEFKESLSVRGFFPDGLIIQKDGTRYVIKQSRLVEEQSP